MDLKLWLSKKSFFHSSLIKTFPRKARFQLDQDRNVDRKLKREWTRAKWKAAQVLCKGPLGLVRHQGPLGQAGQLRGRRHMVTRFSCDWNSVKTSSREILFLTKQKTKERKTDRLLLFKKRLFRIWSLKKYSIVSISVLIRNFYRIWLPRFLPKITNHRNQSDFLLKRGFV